MVPVLDALRRMTGPRQRCMYCGDSHGTDIDHYRPKALFPQYLFQWPNLILSCTECGRFKGSQFPLVGGGPGVVNPTAEDPWEFLDFDPRTGNITARFNAAANEWEPRGVATVSVLQLDRREALSEGCLRAYRRIAQLISAALSERAPSEEHLISEIRALDDLGLAENGASIEAARAIDAPFWTADSLPELWSACQRAFDS